MTDHYILIGKQAVRFDVRDQHGVLDPARLMEWADNHREHWRVAETVVGDVRVSTIWLGLDHNWFGGTPLLFETMTFVDGESVDQARWSTWAQAETGHMEIVEKVERLNEQPVSITSETLRSLMERAKHKDRK